MLVVKNNGQICKECGDFSRKFVICEVCKKKVCMTCSGNQELCMEHFIILKKKPMLNDYFKEKYRVVT